ncbi:DNA-processing protein DprA [Microbacter sp. GSS18]|nr:DNA-processing protein DprA [Microbacter sp. GSS18]
MSGLLLSPSEVRAAVQGVRMGALGDDEVTDAYAWAVWSVLAEPGDGVAGRLIGAVGAEAALGVVVRGDRAAPSSAEIDASELSRALGRWTPRLSADAVRAALRAAALAGVALVTRSDPVWPRRVLDLGAHAPLCLWVRGDPRALLADPGVALVGARAATSYGEHVAMELAADLAAGGIGVVSGGAYGIDGAAHRAALSARGTTIALSAGGVDRPYPAGHAALFDRIAANGAVVAEVPCGAAPTKWRFLQRNRTIAALASATVVVEAGSRSGSLNTAGHAAALGRPLGAVPGPVTSAASVGTHRLLREYGAECITGADDVRELLGWRSSMDRSGAGGQRSPEATRVLDALATRSPRSTEDIAARSGMSPADVESALGVLELDGAAVRTVHGWRSAVRRHR